VSLRLEALSREEAGFDLLSVRVLGGDSSLGEVGFLGNCRRPMGVFFFGLIGVNLVERGGALCALRGADFFFPLGAALVLSIGPELLGSLVLGPVVLLGEDFFTGRFCVREGDLAVEGAPSLASEVSLLR